MEPAAIMMACCCLVSSMLLSLFGFALLALANGGKSGTGGRTYGGGGGGGGGGGKPPVKEPRTSQPRQYDTHDRLSLVGTVVKATKANVDNCKRLCDTTKKCDWAEVHGGTCVLKNSEWPAKCLVPRSGNRCADGFKDGVTLLNPKNSDGTPVLTNLDKTVKTLNAYVDETKCNSKCTFLKAMNWVGPLLMAVPGGGVFATIATTAFDVATSVAEAVVGTQESIAAQKRAQLMGDGRVRSNLPPKWMSATACLKTFNDPTDTNNYITCVSKDNMAPK